MNQYIIEYPLTLPYLKVFSVQVEVIRKLAKQVDERTYHLLPN